MLNKLFLATALLAVALVGCGKKEEAAPSTERSTSGKSATNTPAPAPSAGPKDGWKEVKSAGFSLHVPNDWTPVDLTSANLDAIIDEASKQNEGAKMAAAQFKQIAAAGMVKLMIYGKVDPAGPFAENMNVVVMPANAVPTADQMVEAYKAQIKPLSAPGTDQTGGPHSMPAGDGVKMHSELAMASGNAKSVASLAYMLPKDGKMFTITFSSLPGRAADMEKLADEIMQSFKVG